MKSARFITPARQEFLESVRFYESEAPGLGVRLATAVGDASLRALEFPLAGTPMRGGLRRVLVRGFPFAVVYRLEDYGIVIFAVAHLSRRPDYWNLRTDS